MALYFKSSSSSKTKNKIKTQQRRNFISQKRQQNDVWNNDNPTGNDYISTHFLLQFTQKMFICSGRLINKYLLPDLKYDKNILLLDWLGVQWHINTHTQVNLCWQWGELITLSQEGQHERKLDSESELIAELQTCQNYQHLRELLTRVLLCIPCNASHTCRHLHILFVFKGI